MTTFTEFRKGSLTLLPLDGSQSIRLDVNQITFYVEPDARLEKLSTPEVAEISFEIELGDPLKMFLGLGVLPADTADQVEEWLTDDD